MCLNATGRSPSRHLNGCAPDPGEACDEADDGCISATAPADTLPRCGDIVLHRPSGQRWVTAWAEDGYLSAAGWPESVDPLSDFDIIKRVDDAAHAKAVAQWRDASDGARRSRVLRLYGDILKPPT